MQRSVIASASEAISLTTDCHAPLRSARNDGYFTDAAANADQEIKKTPNLPTCQADIEHRFKKFEVLGDVIAIIKKPFNLYQKLYKIVFWIGYTATLLVAFLPIAGDLSKTRVHALTFEIRLDHLLHFGAYLLICLYYLAGRKLGYSLFNTKPLLKFLMVVLLLAVVTEVVQLWVPERAFNPFDLVANVAGLVMGGVLIVIWGRRQRQRQ